MFTNYWPDRSRAYWKAHPHQAPKSWHPQPNHPLVWWDSHTLPIWGEAATEPTLVPVDCCKDHKCWKVSLHTGQSQEHSSSDKLSMENWLCRSCESLCCLEWYGMEGSSAGPWGYTMQELQGLWSSQSIWLHLWPRRHHRAHHCASSNCQYL